VGLEIYLPYINPFKKMVLSLKEETQGRIITGDAAGLDAY
jgi:hypothetical protein